MRLAHTEKLLYVLGGLLTLKLRMPLICCPTCFFMFYAMLFDISFTVRSILGCHGTNIIYFGAEQEKELLERHNSWLNEELTSKVNNLIHMRKEYGEHEADLSGKLADVRFGFLCTS